MKTNDFTPTNYYSCQICNKQFISLKYEEIEQGTHPVCSSKCNFMVVYNFIKKMDYSDNQLSFMQKIITKKEKITEFKRQTAIFVISKHYVNKGLSSINLLGQRDRDKFETDKKSDNETKGQEFPPYVNRGNVPVSVPSFIKPSKSVLVPKSRKKEEYEWF